MNNARKMTEGAILGGIYLVLLLIATYAPVINMLAMLVMPVPIILYWIRHGFKPGAYFVLAILLFSFIGTLAGFFLTISVAIGAAATGYSLHHKQSTYEALLKGAAGYALGFTIFLAGTQFVSGINMIDEIQNSYQATLQSLQSEMDTVGVGVTDAQWEQVNAMFDYIMVLIPTMIAVFSLLYAFITQWLAQKIHNRQSKDHWFSAIPPVQPAGYRIVHLFYRFFRSLVRYRSEWMVLSDCCQCHGACRNPACTARIFILLLFCSSPKVAEGTADSCSRTIGPFRDSTAVSCAYFGYN